MATTVDLGKVRPVWKGTWSGSTAYEVHDMVKNGVNSYICTTTHTSDASTFSNDSANWDDLAQGAEIPSQSGQAGNFLQSDGSTLSWTSLDVNGRLINYKYINDYGSGWTGWLTGGTWTDVPGIAFDYTYQSANSYLIVQTNIMVSKADANGYWIYTRFRSDRNTTWEIDEQMEHRSTNTYNTRIHSWVDTTSHSAGDTVTYNAQGGSSGSQRWGFRGEGTRGMNAIILEVSS